MRKFSKEFSHFETFDQPGRLIPWRTIIEIMNKSKSHEEMLWYIQQTHSNSWSRSMVINQIALKAYERSVCLLFRFSLLWSMLPDSIMYILKT